jgi:hypothetical protein
VNPRLDALAVGKCRHLLEDPWVRRFYYDKCRRSVKTGKSYLKILGRVMEALGHTPSSFIALGQDEREGRLIDYLEWMSVAGGPEGKGCTDGYVDTTAAIIRSWMAFRRVPMESKMTLHRNPARSRSTRTVIPPRDGLRHLMQLAPLRIKFLVSCTAYSAMRYDVLSDRDQQDGLRFGDLPEVHIIDGKVHFDAIPTFVRVRWSLSKNGLAYGTFWCQETCSYFKDLTEARIRDGEDITPQSVVFPPKANCPSGFLGEGQMHTLVRKAMDAAGLTESAPYTWKSYCIDGLSLAERDEGGLTKEQRLFIVGHECGFHADYALRKRDLTPESKEQMRRAYEEAAAKYLEAFPEVKKDDGRLFEYRILLKALNYTDEELAALDLSNKTEKELVKLAQEALRKNASAVQIAASSAPAAAQTPAAFLATTHNPAAKLRHRLVAPAELEALLTEGWHFVRELRDGRILVAAAS